MKVNFIKVMFFILLLLIMLVIFILIFFREDILSEVSRKEYGYSTMGVYKDPGLTYNEEKILVYKNINIFKNFNGKLPISTMTQNIKDIFLSNIPNLLINIENLSAQKLINYYVENETEIYKKIKIDSKESFLNMVTKFNNINCNLKEDYKECSFSQEFDTIIVKFMYENNQNIECNILGNDVNTFILKF